MDEVRFGVIGAAGNMAGHHLKYLPDLPRVRVTAIADINDSRKDALLGEHPDAAWFDDGAALIEGGDVDAVLIACPHYDHPPYARAAFERGIHVLTEKPVAVTAKAAAATNEAYEVAKKKHPRLVYGGMFQQRADPEWQTVKRLCEDGSVGELIRVSWTITNWFRTQAYYDSGGWRATWKGEGGGVLINQCPHNLDLFCWFVGLPKRVIALAGIGKRHHIEVEDDIAAVLEMDNGAFGTFVTSTGESPGINRLEIAGENGTIVAEPGQHVTLYRNHVAVQEYINTSSERFGKVTTDKLTIEPGGRSKGHRQITENFVAAVLDGEDLLAPAVEGIRGLELGNAMLMSGLQDNRPIDLPTGRDAFEKLLQELIDRSTFEKAEVKDTGPVAMGSSF